MAVVIFNNSFFIYLCIYKMNKKGIIKNGSCHSDLFEGRLVKVSV